MTPFFMPINTSKTKHSLDIMQPVKTTKNHSNANRTIFNYYICLITHKYV